MKPSELMDAVIVTAELCGHELSPAAARVMASELANYDPAAVASALTRIRREAKGRLTLAAIIERLPGQHPGADEAWAIAARGLDERATVVWTDEIAEAFGLARPLLIEGDKVGARMAFRDAYNARVQESRDERSAPKWHVSPGHDAQERDRVVRDAVAAGKLSQRWLPEGASVVRALPRGGGTVPVGDILATLQERAAKAGE